MQGFTCLHVAAMECIHKLRAMQNVLQVQHVAGTSLCIQNGLLPEGRHTKAACLCICNAHEVHQCKSAVMVACEGQQLS